MGRFLLVLVMAFFAALALVENAQGQASQGSPVQPHPAQDQTADGAKSRAPILTRSPIPITIGETPAQTEDRRHDAEDRIAQIRAAQAAENQVIPAWLGAALTFVGTCLVVWTFWETRRASRAELRAYVMIANGNLVHWSHVKPFPKRGNRPERAHAMLLLKNFGATPAFDVKLAVGVAVLSSDTDPLLERRIDLTGFPEQVIAPTDVVIREQGRIIDGKVVDLTADEIAAIKSATKAVYVFGAAEYRDVFGRRRRTDFRLRWTGNWPPPQGNRFFYCSVGNTAT